MAVTNYYSVGGELIGEATSGVRTDYLRDALGSVTGTVDGTGHAQRSYSYKPYGSDLATSGTGSDPRFRWVGSQGYRDTGLAHAGHYVRLRDYAREEGRWTSVDPLVNAAFLSFMRQCLNPFLYVRQRVATATDPLGLDDGIQFDNCVRISFPFTLGGVFTLEVGIEVCKECYVPPRCPQCLLPDPASECASVGLFAEFSTSKLGGEIFKLWKILENWQHFKVEVEVSAYFIIQMLQGSVGMAVCHGTPTEACKDKGNRGKGEICLVLCFGVWKIEGCGFVEGPPLEYGFEGSERFGFCGIPSIGIKIEGSYVQCR